MKRVGKSVICLLGGFALGTATYAAVNPEGADDSSTRGGNPYNVIVDRNVFDLRAPPPPASSQPTNTPPPNIKLTGITTILGKKQALFMVQEPAPPGKPANKEESFILTEGQRQGAIEVLEINNSAKQPTVKIKNDGTVAVLTFEKVNLPQAPASAPPALAGAPGAPGSPNPVHMPNMIPPPGGGGGYNPANRYGYNNNNQPVGYNNGVNPNGSGGLTSIPTRTTRSGYDQQPQPQLSREEQIIMMNAQQMANPSLPPPPVSFNNNGSGGQVPPSPSGQFPAPPPVPR
jgi:hypothetical protein